MTMPESRIDQRVGALQNAWRAAEQATAYQQIEETARAQAEAVIARAWAAIAETLIEAE